MTRQDRITRNRAMKIALVLGTGLALAGCQETTGNPFGFLKPKTETGDAAAAKSESGTKLVERDVEAPQVFSVDEKGLWDGRPSLGGVWVAYPGVKDPERVIVRNKSNGKFVIGALFKRELDAPGPKLQVSSDAADALGMLAGAPTELSVIALRRETAPAETAQAEPLVSKPVIAQPETVEQSSLDAPGDTGGSAAKPASVTGDTASMPTKPQPKPAKPAIGAPPAPGPAPAPPVAATTQTAAAPKAPAGRMYVQIGIFSSEANAKRAQSQMAKAGIIASIRKETSHSKTFWRVVAGPAPSKTDLKALETTIHGLGYPDAFPVSN